jgi:hypothetical protein
MTFEIKIWQKKVIERLVLLAFLGVFIIISIGATAFQNVFLTNTVAIAQVVLNDDPEPTTGGKITDTNNENLNETDKKPTAEKNTTVTDDPEPTADGGKIDTKPTAEKTDTTNGNLLGKNFGCSIPDVDVRIGNLITPAAFVPVIPTQCSISNGDPIPLSPALIPVVLSRFFGMLASLIFYFMTFVFIIAGFMWIWGFINDSAIGKAKQAMRDAGISAIVVISVYVIIGTIVGVLGGSSIKTDLSSYFYTNTNIAKPATEKPTTTPIKEKPAETNDTNKDN